MSLQYQLKVTLKDIEPAVWRRVVVPGDCSLDQLHAVIQISMGWDSTHLYQFRIGCVRYCAFDDELSGNSIDSVSVQLSELANKGDRFGYQYDFGDGWDHTVLVEAVTEHTGRRQIECLAGSQACPPDDVGGPWGYADFVEAMADPDHERHEELLEWFGCQFDPSRFDVAETNALLKQRMPMLACLSAGT